MSALYKQDDMVWCRRCARIECVGAVFHNGPYTTENSRPAMPEEIAAFDEPCDCGNCEINGCEVPNA